MRLKYTMLFSYRSNLSGASLGQRDGGWSESVYGDEGETEPAAASFRSLMQRRVALLGSGARIVGQRYQFVDPTGGSVVATEIFPSSSGIESDTPQTSLYFRLPCAGTPNQARIVLRGMPDDIVHEGEYKPPTTGFNLALARYQRELVGWRIKARNLQADQADIVSIDDEGNMETMNDFAAEPGDWVRVLRSITEEGNKVGGLFKIEAAPTATSFKLKDWNLGETTKGRVRINDIIYPAIANVTGAFGIRSLTPRVIERKVGRSFGSYRGRASARR